MDAWLRTFAGGLAAEAAETAGTLVRRSSVSAGFMLAAAAAFATAIGFMAAALYTLLDRAYGDLTAQLVLAATFALAGGLIVLLARAYGRRPTAPARAAYAAAAEETRPDSLALVASAFALGFARGINRRRANGAGNHRSP